MRIISVTITHQESFCAWTELQITEQPQSNTSIKYGQDITLSVSATGAENLIYLWKKDREDLTGHGDHYIGTNTPTLTINEFLPDDQGKYVCIIKNCNSSIESEQADLKLGMSIFIELLQERILLSSTLQTSRFLSSQRAWVVTTLLQYL